MRGERGLSTAGQVTGAGRPVAGHLGGPLTLPTGAPALTRRWTRSGPLDLVAPPADMTDSVLPPGGRLLPFTGSRDRDAGTAAVHHPPGPASRSAHGSGGRGEEAISACSAGPGCGSADTRRTAGGASAWDRSRPLYGVSATARPGRGRATARSRLLAKPPTGRRTGRVPGCLASGADGNRAVCGQRLPSVRITRRASTSTSATLRSSLRTHAVCESALKLIA